MQLFVRYLNKIITIEIEPSDNVWMIKFKIEQKKGIPILNQKLYSSGDILENDELINDRKLQKKNGILLFLDNNNNNNNHDRI